MRLIFVPISYKAWNLLFVPITFMAASCSAKFIIDNPQQSRAGDGLYVQRIELAERYASTVDKNLILVCYNLIGNDKLQAQSCENEMGFTLFNSKNQNGKWQIERNNPMISLSKIKQIQMLSSSVIFAKFNLPPRYKIKTKTIDNKLYSQVFAGSDLLATIDSLPRQ